MNLIYIVLSRNNVNSINKIISAVEQSLMKKLNKKKIKWIVKEVEKREMGVYAIAKVQKITQFFSNFYRN
ncbi:hypothetical protein HYW75_06390 [Candidatus Pacearchaeota archaeon]|nr:hypothetical protein [Candidatus Pacearchaeota archaeon]